MMPHRSISSQNQKVGVVNESELSGQHSVASIVCATAQLQCKVISHIFSTGKRTLLETINNNVLPLSVWLACCLSIVL